MWVQDLAYRMVSKMGWTEGQGLGANNDGITKHLWTKKRADAVGIGAENSNDWGAHSLQTNVYNSLLAKLEVICNSSGSDSSCRYPSDRIFLHASTFAYRLVQTYALLMTYAHALQETTGGSGRERARKRVRARMLSRLTKTF